MGQKAHQPSPLGPGAKMFVRGLVWEKNKPSMSLVWPIEGRNCSYPFGANERYYMLSGYSREKPGYTTHF